MPALSGPCRAGAWIEHYVDHKPWRHNSCGLWSA